jgi:hypothetical protein
MFDCDKCQWFVNNVMGDWCSLSGKSTWVGCPKENEKQKENNNNMMKLADTVNGMNSADYKERFIAEYNQLKIRVCGLDNMMGKWRRNELTFEPTCPYSTYELQIRAMRDYMAILEMRAVMEGIELDTSLMGA